MILISAICNYEYKQCLCVLPGVFVLDRALSMPSGVMSTRDRMLARAGLGGVALEAADWPDGVVGVPGDGRGDGLAAERQTRAERDEDQSHCTNLRNDSKRIKSI